VKKYFRFSIKIFIWYSIKSIFQLT